MEANLDVIRAMFRSLSAGERIYKFSELRDLLAKENVDVSGFNLRRKADQQALLSAAEKCIYDLERSLSALQENRIQIDIREFEDAVNNESDYPDIPLTYAWQFEGVDGSKDCFLYPMTPLTCDVLSGQCCDLSMVTKYVHEDSGEFAGAIVFGDPIVGHIVPENQPNKFSTQPNRSKSTVKGFGRIKSIQVESAVIPMPYIGDIVAYRPDGNDVKWLDLDDLTEQLEVAFSPELEKIKVHQVKPINGKYKNQSRRAIRIKDSTKIIDRASELGNKKARKLYSDMVGHGMQELGIKGAVMIEGRVIPHDKDGSLLEQYAINTGKHTLLIDNWLLIENWQEYDKNTDTPDYSSLPMVINLMVASIANRKVSGVRRYVAIEFLEWIYPSLGLDQLVRQEAFVEALGNDEELYVTLYQDMLSEVRKQAVINVFKLPDCFHVCDEIKSIVDAKTSKDPSIKLINNWLHPLSETNEGITDTNGEPYCNTWQFASMCVGAAAGRAPATNSQAATGMMIDLGVIDSKDSVALEQAKSDDSIYLQLLGAVKEAMDTKVHEAFNRE